jgi:hypothetical protein
VGQQRFESEPMGHHHMAGMAGMDRFVVAVAVVVVVVEPPRLEIVVVLEPLEVE